MSYEVEIVIKKVTAGDFLIARKEVVIFKSTIAGLSLVETLALTQAHLDLVKE